MFRGQNSTFVGKTQGNPWHELTRASAKSPSLALVHRLISLSRSFDLGRLSAPRVLHNRGNRHSLITLSDRYCTSRTSVCVCTGCRHERRNGAVGMDLIEFKYKKWRVVRYGTVPAVSSLRSFSRSLSICMWHMGIAITAPI